jgi:hypothetical protein
MTLFNLDQREEIADLLESPTWITLMGYVDHCVKNLETRVLTCDVEGSDRAFILRASELKGAREMRKMLTKINEHVNFTEKEKRNVEIKKGR